MKKSEVGREKQTQRISLEGHAPKLRVGTPAKVAVRNQMPAHVFLLVMEMWNYRKHNSSFPLITTLSSKLTAFQNELHLATKTYGTEQAHLLVVQSLEERSLLATPSLSGPRAPQPTGALENPFCRTARNFCSHSKHWACCAPNKQAFKTSVGTCIYVKWLHGPAGW